MLVSGGRRRRGVGRHDGLHAELLEPLDGEKIIPQSDVLISPGGQCSEHNQQCAVLLYIYYVPNCGL